MDTIDDHTFRHILSYLSPNDIRNIHKMSIRTFRVIATDKTLRRETYASWKDSVRYNDIDYFRELVQRSDIPSNVLLNHTFAQCATKLPFLVCLHENKYSWDIRTCIIIVKSGRLECLQYIHEQGCPIIDNLMCYYAVLSGNVNCLQYVHTYGNDIRYHVCYTAAKMGHLDCLKYCCEHGGMLEPYTYYMTITHGHLECFKYLHELCPFSRSDRLVCDLAIEYHHFDILKYACDQGFVCASDMIKHIPIETDI
jgi:hypothetical protein